MNDLRSTSYLRFALQLLQLLLISGINAQTSLLQEVSVLPSGVSCSDQLIGGGSALCTQICPQWRTHRRKFTVRHQKLGPLKLGSPGCVEMAARRKRKRSVPAMPCFFLETLDSTLLLGGDRHDPNFMEDGVGTIQLEVMSELIQQNGTMITFMERAIALELELHTGVLAIRVHNQTIETDQYLRIQKWYKITIQVSRSFTHVIGIRVFVDGRVVGRANQLYYEEFFTMTNDLLRIREIHYSPNFYQRFNGTIRNLYIFQETMTDREISPVFEEYKRSSNCICPDNAPQIFEGQQDICWDRGGKAAYHRFNWKQMEGDRMVMNNTEPANMIDGLESTFWASLPQSPQAKAIKIIIKFKVTALGVNSVSGLLPLRPPDVLNVWLETAQFGWKKIGMFSNICGDAPEDEVECLPFSGPGLQTQQQQQKLSKDLITNDPSSFWSFRLEDSTFKYEQISALKLELLTLYPSTMAMFAVTEVNVDMSLGVNDMCSKCNWKHTETCKQGKCVCRGSSTPSVYPRKEKITCDPFVTGQSRLDGPVSGGTIIEFWGENLEFETGAKVLFVGNISFPCDIDYSKSNSTVLTCVSRENPERTIGSSFSIDLKLSDRTLRGIGSFQFIEDPVVSAVEPQQAPVMGGVNQMVTGKGFTKISRAFMKIYTYYQLQRFAWPDDQGGRTKCSIESDSRIICQSPRIWIPDRSDEDVMPQRRKRSEKRDDRFKGFAFYISLDLNGIEKHINLKGTNPIEAIMKVCPNPHISTFKEQFGSDVYEHDTSKGLTMYLKGERLLSCNLSESNYRIKVDESNCEVEKITLDNLLSCKLPEDIDNKKVYFQLGNMDASHKLLGFISIYSWLSKFWWIILLVVMLVLAAVAFLVFMFWQFKGRKDKQTEILQNELEDIELEKKQLETKALQNRRNSILNELDPIVAKKVADLLLPETAISLTDKRLGEGQFGEIFLATFLDKEKQAQQVAVKMIKNSSCSTKDLSDFLEEATIMKDMKHPNLLSPIGVIIDSGRFKVIIPFMENGDLHSYIKTHRVSLKQSKAFAQDVASGMMALAAKSFVHRDLAARNCLLDENLRAHVGDFGLSRDIYHQDYYQVKQDSPALPLRWMAMESINSLKFSHETDVWSFGVMTWEVFTGGAVPYTTMNNHQVMSHILNGGILEKPANCPDVMYEQMRSCWHSNPKSRPTFSEIVSRLEKITLPTSAVSAEKEPLLPTSQNPDAPGQRADKDGYLIPNKDEVNTYLETLDHEQP